ncbi:flavoprotein [Heliobacterium chlorum]|uniref:Flavoprotein n=1 Tax=Heliobacterium chlorum TaxID=2698 RepID=A0ABR7T2S7_HELCL|nr:flavoprotein [Heliobacterium chlorum]MBC9783846.1 flavoprotein [Heliobacterium chlorum]
MDDNLVRLVTAEVMRRLNQAGIGNEPPTRPRFRVMAIFTGGSIGLEEGLQSLQELEQRSCEMTIVLSHAAEQIVGVKRIKERLGDDVEIITPSNPYPGKLLRQADLVMVPVLTQNTMAKLAHTLSDTLPTTLVFQALMLGKPVIAAQNAADPKDCWRTGAAMDKAPIVLVRAFQENLQRVRDYGVQLVDVNRLATEAGQMLDLQLSSDSDRAPAKTAVKKGLVTAEMIRSVALNGGRTFNASTNDVITPLARDIARDFGVEIITA